MSMEDPIVIPTAKSVQKTLQTRNLLKAEAQVTHVPATATKASQVDVVSSVAAGKLYGSAGSLHLELVREKLAALQSDRSRQTSLLKSLEDLLKADLEALQAGKPPPKELSRSYDILKGAPQVVWN